MKVTAQDKNVYLLDDVTVAELKEGSQVTVGGVTLDLTKATDPDNPYHLSNCNQKYRPHA